MISLIENHIKKYHIPMHEVRLTDYMGVVDGGIIKSARNRYDDSERTYKNYDKLISQWDHKIKTWDLPSYTIRVYGKGDFPWEERYLVQLSNDDLIAFLKTSYIAV
ncbi:MAG: hypothetical protein Q8910_00145 [Bacteroidota bacterium]|nr:hypothetical protein [Bacteroidota bacterium]